MAKRVKYLIGDWANIGNGTEVYDLVSGEHKDINAVAVNNPAPPPPVAQEDVSVVPPPPKEIAFKKEHPLVPLKESEAAPISKQLYHTCSKVGKDFLQMYQL